MDAKKVLIQWQGGDRPWRLYWSETMKLADRTRYATIEEAGAAARALMGEKKTVRRRPLRIVRGRKQAKASVAVG